MRAASTELVEVEDSAAGGKNMPRRQQRPTGRPESQITRNSRTIADKWIMKGNRAPLEVMLRNMQYFDQKADQLVRQAGEWVSEPDSDEEWAERMKLLAAVKFNRVQAQDCARDAAPFMHPKFTSVQVSGDKGAPWHIMLSAGDEDL